MVILNIKQELNMNRKIFLFTVVITSLILSNCSDKELEVTEKQKEQMQITAADFMGEFTYLRYMKPILIQPEGLNCHGSESIIQEEVSKLIAERYPNDKARYYKPGDLRNAVSSKKLIE